MYYLSIHSVPADCRGWTVPHPTSLGRIWHQTVVPTFSVRKAKQRKLEIKGDSNRTTRTPREQLEMGKTAEGTSLGHWKPESR